MGNRRMFSRRIVNSARFLKMPISTQCLYFHLGLHADDDGVVEAYTVMNSTGTSEDDLRVLAAKNFISILNEDLVSYITDWNENNTIRADRKVDSIYKDLLIQMHPDIKLLEPRARADTGKRTGQPMDGEWTTNGQPMDGLSKDKLSKDKLSKDKLSKDKLSKDSLIEVKEREEDNNSFLPSLISNYTNNSILSSLLYKYMEFRIVNNLNMSVSYIEKLLNYLDKLADTDEQKIAIVETAIDRQWKKFFPVNKKPNNRDYIKGNENFDDEYLFGV